MRKRKRKRKKTSAKIATTKLLKTLLITSRLLQVRKLLQWLPEVWYSKSVRIQLWVGYSLNIVNSSNIYFISCPPQTIIPTTGVLIENKNLFHYH